MTAPNDEGEDEPTIGDRSRRLAMLPVAFSGAARSAVAVVVYFADPPTHHVAAFFEQKGLSALKEEERRDQWYEDWLAYQGRNRIYASVLAPREYSSSGNMLDLPRWARFLEVFGYFSPGHGYSAQVTFLGLFAILMGSNDAVKREAVSALERGGLLAFGVSEKEHGSDLLGNEFTIRESSPGRFIAGGSKYYIGNCNVAQIICTLARKDVARAGARGANRAPVALIALRPATGQGFRVVRRIHTLGVRQAFVGAFEVTAYELPASDIIAEGRQAWDAVLGAVNLGKFFLGFGSIGICEHAFFEALEHLGGRILYGKPVIRMPHIRAAMSRAYVRITAMKLFAYRALDYVQAARANDRRYLLYCAVQKARVSTEGVRAIALISECVGAKGFEADTYFEMALRDIELIPGLESSAHINLGLAAQFAPRYFDDFARKLVEPATRPVADTAPRENAYLFEARSSALHTIGFPNTLRAYRSLSSVQNVRIFAMQVAAFRRILRDIERTGRDAADTQFTTALGECISTIAYGELVAEQVRRLGVDLRFVSAMFGLLVNDLHAAIQSMLSLPTVKRPGESLLRRALALPETSADDWGFVAAQIGAE